MLRFQYSLERVIIIIIITIRIEKKSKNQILLTGLHEFDALKNPEVNNYRWLAVKFTESFAKMRKNCSKLVSHRLFRLIWMSSW